MIGIFVFALLVLRFKQSAFMAAIALRDHRLPLVSRATQEVLELVPQSLREASQALGVSKWRTVLRVVLPTTLGGIVTGTTLAVARAAGETAPILFTSTLFAQRDVSATRGTPSHSIPFMIFIYSESPDPNLHEQAWAGAFVLIMFVLDDEPEGARFLAPKPAKADGRREATAPRSARARDARGRDEPRSQTFHQPFTGFQPTPVQPADTGGRNPTTKGEGDTHHMKRMLTTVAAALAVGLSPPSAPARRAARTADRRRQHVRRAARLAVAGRLRVEDRHADRVQPGRLGRGHRRDHRPPGRLRRQRRAAHPDQFNACNGLRPDPVGAVGDLDHLQPPNVPNNLHMTGAVLAKIYLGQITKWDDPAIKALNPKVSLPSTASRRSTAATTRARRTTSPITSPRSARRWKSKIGVGVNANWPAGQGGKGSARRRRRRLEHAGRARVRRRRLRAEEPPEVHVDEEPRAGTRRPGCAGSPPRPGRSSPSRRRASCTSSTRRRPIRSPTRSARSPT